MPERTTIERARRDLRAGKRPSTAAGEFVREEMEHVREGKHGARSTRQAIAIGLSKARRAGVPLAPPAKGETTRRTRRAAERDLATGQGRRKAQAPSRRRSAAVKQALKREGHSAASHRALARHSHQVAGRRRARTGRARSGRASGR